MTWITTIVSKAAAFFDLQMLVASALTALACLGLHLLWRWSVRKKPDTTVPVKNSRYKDAQHLASIGHWDYDFRTNRLVWSDEVYRIFGIDREDFDGTLEQFYDLIHPDDRKETIRLYTLAIEEGEDYEADHRIIHKTGKTVHVRERCHTSFDDNGKPVQSLGTIQDVTAQTKAEMELRKAKREAEAAARAKNAFLATMSHEIRTPLNGILGMLQLIAGTPLGREQKEYVGMAITSSERLSDLLADILELTELESGSTQLQNEPFNLHETLSNIVDFYTDTARLKGLLLHLNIGTKLPTLVSGDEARLRLILFNLIGNAVKFTEQGSVTVDAGQLLKDKNGNTTVLFTISDTGPGISDEMMTQALEPFTQAEDFMIRKHGGSGLGLSIVRGLTRVMNGTLAISTKEGSGTEICMSLSLGPAPDDYICPAIAQPQTTSALDGHTILLVEDDAISQTAISKLLQKHGLHVDIAQNGLEALEKIRSSKHQLILMDINMPVMDGMEATRAIREGKAGNDKSSIPIVALTAYAMSGDRNRFIQAGMNDYLPKPVSADSLRAMLDREIRRQVGH